MRIVFMGTPYFAVPSLEKLIENGHEIAAVVTQPDRRCGRGQKQKQPPVKLTALENGISILQFDKVKSEEGVNAIKRLEPDLIVTAAFGQILSKQILEIPKHGCINVHASLLPKYRGAAPIQWAIIKGEKKSGVTIMYMDEGLDTGDIIISRQTDIPDDMTGGALYEKLALIGADLLIEAIKGIENGKVIRTKQNDEESSYFPPLSRQLGLIDWKQPANDIRNLVRALDPVMSAYTFQGEEMYKIWKASTIEGKAKPGKLVEADQKKGIIVGTGSGLLKIEEIQAPCCRRMSSADFLRGNEFEAEFFE